jgi:hypothetical protein
MSIQRFQQIMGMAPRMPLISQFAVQDKDYVVSGSNTNPNNSGLYSNIYVIDRNTGQPTILWTPRTTEPIAAALTPNWVTMDRNNRNILTAHADIGLNQGRMARITQQGGIVTFTPAVPRIDDINLRDAGGLIMAGGTIFRTDDNAGSVSTLIALPPAGTLNGAENEDNGLYAFQSQAAVPTGGINEFDLEAPTPIMTRTIATGLGGCNTVTYRVADGNWYVSEFDILGTATGAIYRITNAGAITTLASGASIDRTNSIDVDQEGRLLIASRHRLFLMDSSNGAILQTITFDYERLRASSGAIVYGGNRLQFNTQGGTTPGSIVQMQISFRNPAAPGSNYVGAFATTARPGITLPNGEQLNLFPGDPLFFPSLSGLFDALWPGRSGVLGTGGDASASLLIPPSLPPGLNLRIFVAFAAVIGGQVSATETEGFTIR